MIRALRLRLERGTGATIGPSAPAEGLRLRLDPGAPSASAGPAGPTGPGGAGRGPGGGIIMGRSYLLCALDS